MRFVVNPLALAVFAFTTTAMSASDAMSEDVEAGWVPSVALGLGITTTDLNGSVRAVDSAGSPIRPPDSGSERAVTPLLAFTAAMATPRVAALPGRPRLFVAAEVLPTFGATYNVANEGNPTGAVAPPGATRFPEEGIGGQGSRTAMQMDPLAYGATAGFEFPISIGDAEFSVKPSVRYLRYSFDVDGTVVRAIKPDVIDPFFREISLTSSGTIDAHGVGPAIELEFPAWKIGPLDSFAFAEFAGYYNVGDSDIELTDSVTITDQLGTETYSAVWNGSIGTWLLRGSVGIRIRFQGF
jgi:hypothetical protein